MTRTASKISVRTSQGKTARPKTEKRAAPSNAVSHRRGGYARGAETKDRIIHAALDLFGEQGYDQTSTRDIAARAGVNAPALQYYFDGKEGLYRACAEHMAGRAQVLMAPAVDKVNAVLKGRPGTDALIECVWMIVERLADAMLLSGEVDSWARFKAWEEIRQAKGPNSASAIIEKCFRKDINDLMRRLIGQIIGKKPDDIETRIRAITLMGQITVFFAMREKALIDIGWDSLNESRLETLKSIIRCQIVAALKFAAGKSKK
jgi:AcrR family transcriptional regulator